MFLIASLTSPHKRLRENSNLPSPALLIILLSSVNGNPIFLIAQTKSLEGLLACDLVSKRGETQIRIFCSWGLASLWLTPLSSLLLYNVHSTKSHNHLRVSKIVLETRVPGNLGVKLHPVYSLNLKFSLRRPVSSESITCINCLLQTWVITLTIHTFLSPSMGLQRI